MLGVSHSCCVVVIQVTARNYNYIISVMNGQIYNWSVFINWAADLDYDIDCNQMIACTILMSAYVGRRPKNTDNSCMVLFYAEISILITYSSTLILSAFLKP